MSERPPHSPCRRNDRHDAHEFDVYGRPFWCPGYAPDPTHAMSKPSGPACGNNPNHQLTDGDRQAVTEFRAYLAERAALRDRIAEALYAHDHPGHLVPLDETGMGSTYRESADAVLSVLPPADRAAILREAADEAERLRDERYGLDFLEGVDWTLAELRRMAAEAQQDGVQR